MMKVKKAVIPAAGLGTRFLPATKTVPKEMLPLVDAPIILYVIEEAMEAGIEDIVLIAGRGKNSIEDFFDCSYELEAKLSKDKRLHLLERVIKVRENVNIISIRQKDALGLGHAVLCAENVIGQEPFAVLLGDEITLSQSREGNVTHLLCNSYEKHGISSVAVMEVPLTDVCKYGIIDGHQIERGLYRVNSLIEKPSFQETPSRLALPGRYAFSPNIFKYLREIKPGKGGEIQLTDAMVQLAKKEGLYALTFSSKRYDAGDKLGYLQANIELALKRSDLGPQLRSYLLKLVEEFQEAPASWPAEHHQHRVLHEKRPVDLLMEAGPLGSIKVEDVGSLMVSKN